MARFTGDTDPSKVNQLIATQLMMAGRKNPWDLSERDNTLLNAASAGELAIALDYACAEPPRPAMVARIGGIAASIVTLGQQLGENWGPFAIIDSRASDWLKENQA